MICSLKKSNHLPRPIIKPLFVLRRSIMAEMTIVPAETPVATHGFFYRRPLDARRRRGRSAIAIRWQRGRTSYAGAARTRRSRDCRLREGFRQPLAASPPSNGNVCSGARLRPLPNAREEFSAPSCTRLASQSSWRALKWTVPFLFSTSPPKKPPGFTVNIFPSTGRSSPPALGHCETLSSRPIAGITPF